MKAIRTLVLLLVVFAVAGIAFAATTSILRPTADGVEDSAAWSTGGGVACSSGNCYTEVDESAGGSCTNSDGDTSYIFSNTNGSAQTFDIDTSGIPDGSTITQIDISVCAVRTQGGTQIQTRRCINGVCTSSGIDIALGTSYSETTQSHTGLSVSKGASTDLEIGVLNNSAKGARVSQIYSVVTYSPPAGDTTAPSAVSNLTLSGATQTSINVSWTAPGDDGSVGTATTYDLRYSTSPITEINFSSATAVTGEPTPSVAGSSESMTVSGLASNTTYYFALKTSDEVPNTSAISNVPSLTTSATPDTTAPDAVSDLTTGSVGQTSISLSWTAPGDDGSTGTATTYDLRYSTSPITEINFSSATAATGEPAPSVAGTSESMTVSGLSANTTYYFALKTSDEVPNTSAISNVVNATTDASPDTTAPDAVSDLSAVSGGQTAINVSWTAPGDDGSTGTATTYDLRYSTANITDLNWSSATAATGEPTPSSAGSSESFSITELASNTTYYVAIKTSDESANESTLSNIASATTDAPEPEPNVSVAGSGSAARNILVRGYAYPGSSIEILQHNENEVGFKNIPIKDVSINNDGTFSAGFLGLTSGNYFIALRIKDKTGRDTGILSLAVNFLYSGDTFLLEDFIAPPTIGFSGRTIATRGALEVEGYASPSAKVTVLVGKEKTYESTAKSDGYWEIKELTGLGLGSYSVRAYQTLSDNLAPSTMSVAKTFHVSDLLYPEADFNGDSKVNITDWSLFLFRWGSKDLKTRALVDLDKNGSVDVGDFSIFLRAMNI